MPQYVCYWISCCFVLLVNVNGLYELRWFRQMLFTDQTPLVVPDVDSVVHIRSFRIHH